MCRVVFVVQYFLAENTDFLRDFFDSSSTSLSGRLASDGKSGMRIFSQGPSGHQNDVMTAVCDSLFSVQTILKFEAQRFCLQTICRDSSFPTVSSGLCFALLQHNFSPFTVITVSLDGDDGDEGGRGREGR